MSTIVRTFSEQVLRFIRLVAGKSEKKIVRDMARILKNTNSRY